MPCLLPHLKVLEFPDGCQGSHDAHDYQELCNSTIVGDGGVHTRLDRVQLRPCPLSLAHAHELGYEGGNL